MLYVFEVMKKNKHLDLSFVRAHCNRDARRIREVCQELKIGLIAPDNYFNFTVISG